MDEFLYVLKIKLMNSLMPDEVDEQIVLYENYMEKEIAGGKTPEQVLNKLGDPIRVAEMIVAHKHGEDEEGSPDAEVVDGTCAGCMGGCFGDSGGTMFECTEKKCADAAADSNGSAVDGKMGEGAAGKTTNGVSGKKKSSSMSAQEINAQVYNPEHGFHAEFKENEGWDIRLGKLKLNTWYGTLIILGIVLVVFILLSELTH